jgi:hypothetical protein
VAKKLDTAMNVLGAVAAGASFLNLNKKSTADSKLTKFYASIKKVGVARTNKFETLITIPKLANFPVKGGIEELMQLRCETANVPGVSINTADIQRYGYGLTEKAPIGAVMADLTCSFIGDAQGEIYKFFYRWMTGIIKWDNKPTANARRSFNYLNPYEVEYKSNYSSTIQLLTYSENEDKLLSWTFYEAFPTGLGEVQYNWGDNDNLVRIPINFAYSYFRCDDIDEDIVLKGSVSNELGPFSKLIKAGTAVQTIMSMKRPRSVGDIINVVNNAKVIASAAF